MIEQRVISPFGTAKELFLSTYPESDPGSSELRQLVPRLMDRVRLYNVDGEIVQLALEMVQWEKALEPVEAKALLMTVTASLILLQQGSTRLPLFAAESEGYVAGILATLIRVDDKQSPTDVANDVRNLLETTRNMLQKGNAHSIVGAYGEYKPLIFVSPHLYHHKLLKLEERFSDRLTRLLSAGIPAFNGRLLEACIREVDGAPYQLSREQRAAVTAAVNFPFTIISGGPGTGKTSVIVSILRVLLRLGVGPESIALAAPTGKAANRMGESIRHALKNIGGRDEKIKDIPDPRTLHRLLGYSPASGRFQCHENNRLAEQFVFIDEGSMIDLFLMERLMRSLREDAHLVLIGDSDQLPSVEAGAVFRDLTAADGNTSPVSKHVVRLIENYRMSEKDPSGRNILSVAKRIKACDIGPLFDKEATEGISVKESVSDIVFDKVELFDGVASTGSLETFLDSWYSSRVKSLAGLKGLIRKLYRYGKDGFGDRDREDLEALFSRLNQSKILCLTRVYDTGSQAINTFFHERFLEEEEYEYSPDFVPGEPVMMLHNDYERNIFNGDQGIILRVSGASRRHHFMAVFRRPEGFAPFHLDALHTSIEHSFAITVHKSQGSEFDHVALVLPEQEIPILTREILYTAVTRSRKSVVIVGAKSLFASGVRNELERFSGIFERLAGDWERKIL